MTGTGSEVYIVYNKYPYSYLLVPSIGRGRIGMKKATAVRPLEPTSRRHLRNAVYERIKAAILTRELDQGSWLQEDELARRFGVSRTPVREALQRLQSEGLLEIIPRRGAFVVKLTFRSVMEMVEVRDALEALAIRLAAERASERQLRDLRQCFESARGAASGAGEEKLALANRVRHFHRLLAEASGNETLSQILKQIYDKLDMYRMRVLDIPGRSSRTRREHLAIAEALEKGDPRLAEKRNRTHMRRVRKEIQDNIHLFD